MRLLKEQGYVPLSVTEGGSKLASDATPQAFRYVFGLVAAAILVVAAVAVVRHVPKPQQKVAAKPAAAKVKKPAPAPKKVAQAPASPQAAPAVAKAEAPAPRTAAAPSPQPAPKAELPAAPKPEEVAVLPPEPTEEQKQELKNMTTASEQLIAMLGQPGEERPPLPIPEEDNLEGDFDQAASNMITVGDADDDRSIAHKANVATVKEYIKEARKMGWTPAEYLRELEKKRQEESAERNAAQVILGEIQEMAPQEARAAQEELNKELEKKGIIPLDPPAEE